MAVLGHHFCVISMIALVFIVAVVIRLDLSDIPSFPETGILSPVIPVRIPRGDVRFC